MKVYSTPSSGTAQTFSFLENEKGCNVAFKPKNNLEDPGILCERLGLTSEADRFMNKKPLVGLSSGGPIWEYYILGLFVDEFNIGRRIYAKLRKGVDDGAVYKFCDKSAIGNEKYDDWIKLYKNKINPTGAQKRKMRSFVKNLVESRKPLREVSNKRLTNSRARAAQVFFEYLTQDFFADKISVKSFVKKKFYEQICYLFKQQRFSKKYLLKVSLLLCLYGCNYRLEDNDAFCINNLDFVSTVKDQLTKLRVYTVNEGFRDNVVEALSYCGGGTFYPPFSYVYQYYRERLSIYMHLNVWSKLIKDTRNAMSLGNK
jgi:hypothetical protein